ncbi:hypothetical protein [Pseudobythopirellula maris]|uniref:hypothetical protein n=1 Tax=Pseudobythopirellula maris TaxID=2527991 RepID=UPI0011B792C5|nr:hypothetical protein [Pseudobythopirellula maris]
MSPVDAVRAYRRVSADFAPPRAEPTWLPAGFLAALFLLTGTLSALGETTAQPTWRSARSTTAAATTKPVGRYDDYVRPAAYGEEASGPRQSGPHESGPHVSGPKYRVAGRMSTHSGGSYRLAQETGDDLERRLGEALERPFGVDEPESIPDPFEQDASRVDESEYPAYDPAEPTFESLPESPDPFEEPTFDEDPVNEKPVNEEPAYEEPSDQGSVYQTLPFDSGPTPRNEPMTPVDPPAAFPRGAEPLDDGSPSAQAMRNCYEDLAELKANRLSDMSLFIGVEGVAGEDFPYECSVDDGSVYSPRSWEGVTYMWKASALCHKPLYFEQLQLERYGHSWGPYVQPIVSGVHFFGTLPVLPYKMGLTPPSECMYTLGYYRPGSCAPYMVHAVPFTWRAVAFEAAGAAAVIGVLP